MTRGKTGNQAGGAVGGIRDSIMTAATVALRKRGERGPSQATIDLIDTCIKIIEPCQPITVRGVCYKLFVAGLVESMAVKNTQKVSRLLRDAREGGRIPWEWIVDESRQLERQPHWSDLVQYARVIEQSYRRDFWADRKYRVIVISEKATVAGVLRPTLDGYGVPFFAAHGFNSATKVHELAAEMQADPRQYAFLYVGDYDPSGMFMSVVDFRERLNRYGAAGRFTFTRIAVTSDDTPGLPSFDAHTKAKDPRYRWFVAGYGDKAWELDAMDPQQLRERVESHIAGYIDSAAWERHKLIEGAQRETTRMVAEQLAAGQ